MTQTPLQLIEQFTRRLAGAKSDLTLKAYGADLRQFFAFIQETDGTATTIERITRGNIEDYLAYLSEKGQTCFR